MRSPASKIEWVVLLLSATATLTRPLSLTWAEEATKTVSAEARHPARAAAPSLHSHKHLKDLVGVNLHALSTTAVHIEAHSAWEASHASHATHAGIYVLCTGTQIVLPTFFRIT